MTIFHVLNLGGLAFGLVYGAKLGSSLGLVVGVIGAIVGGAIGFIVGRLPLLLALKLIQRSFSKKSVEDLRAMLRDPEFLAPNTVLLELRSRGEDLEPELPVVLDMLVAPSRERRIRGWHALATAFPDRAERITDYRVDDAPEECQRKVQKLRSAEPGAPPSAGPAAPLSNSGVTEGPPSVN
jgi:hypothetical protein